MSFDRKFVCDQQAEQVLTLAKEILGDAYIVIQVISLKLLRILSLLRPRSRRNIVEISDNKPRKAKKNSGEGVGLVDACFDGMLKAYEQDYCSLIPISIVDFGVNAHLDNSNTRQSDAQVSALLR